MTTKEPKDAVLLSARIARAYPSLSAYSAATLAEQLCAIERMQRRHAERCCSGEDGGYVKRHALNPSFAQGRTTCLIHDPEAEERAEERIGDRVRDWIWSKLGPLLSQGTEPPVIDREGDPRGPVLRIRLPGESEAIAV